tara:strand:- start:438 stop:1700 length:1263 start_codon:yes stop_codon:yes gene_type:complete
MSAIWESKNKYKIWMDIELHACDAQAKIGLIPKAAAKIIRKKAKFQVQRIDTIEKRVKHDVIAFLTNLAEQIGPQSRFLHQGMTSSDIIDTGFNFQLCQAADLLLRDMDSLLKVLKKRSIQHKKTICMGRSHGMHAEPTTFGFKLAQAYAEFKRNKSRLEYAKKGIQTCSISGAVGNFANIDPSIEKYVAKKMGLTIEPIASQIIPRDRHAFFFSTLATIASSVERLATEVRHLQRTELGEAEEYFSSGQKGSSAMPHKKNPILSENITGLARMIRSYALPAMENVNLWHERDISHSSVERVIAPDATIALDFILNRLTEIIGKLVVHPKAMLENLNKSLGLYNSQRILLALIQKGMSREKAYSIVQSVAMKSWKEKKSFAESLKKDNRITKFLSEKEIDTSFDSKYFLKNVEKIFKRIF